MSVLELLQLKFASLLCLATLLPRLLRHLRHRQGQDPEDWESFSLQHNSFWKEIPTTLLDEECGHLQV